MKFHRCNNVVLSNFFYQIFSGKNLIAAMPASSFFFFLLSGLAMEVCSVKMDPVNQNQYHKLTALNTDRMIDLVKI